MPTSSNPQRLALKLAPRFKGAGVTQSELARAVGASQSQVSRILAGRIVRHTRLLDRICIYASRRLNCGRHTDARRNSELMSALAEVWDGSDQHAHALAQVIRSLAELDELAIRFVKREAKR